MSAIHAPYHFVPLSSKVYLPPWQQEISHDHPFQDGFCGHLDISLLAETPILIGGEQGKGPNGETLARFHQLPDGRYAIPGSSLKGMLRSVLEIAGYGKMQRVTDQHFSMRDLSSGTPFGKINQQTKSAGWLRLEQGKWRLYPAAYIAVKHTELERVDRRFRTVLGEKKASARFEKQAGIGLNQGPFSHFFAVSYQKGTETIKPRKGAPFQKPLAAQVSPGENAVIVFTGDVSGKKREFIFDLPKAGEGELVPEAVMARFAYAHRSNPQNRDTDYDWYMQQRWGAMAPGIPVFYLRNTAGNAIEHMGLAFMFRIGCQESVNSAVAKVQPLHQSEEMDLADCLFGRTEPSGKANLRSRVNIMDAVAEGNPMPLTLPHTVLSSPKASFFPAYLQQSGDGEGRLSGSAYTTFWDTQAKVRGWKRYPVADFRRDQFDHFTRNGGKVSASVQIQLQALPEQTVFKTRLYFHNLKPAELGALWWVLIWGGDSDKRHSLGLGKPLGMGRVQVLVDSVTCRANDPGNAVPDASVLMQTFCHSVAVGIEENPFVPFGCLPEIQHLLHMADPAYGRKKDLTYMPLAEFRNAKGGNANQKLIYAPYVSEQDIQNQLNEARKTAKEKLAQAEKEQEEALQAEQAEAVAAEAEKLKDLGPHMPEIVELLTRFEAMETAQNEIFPEVNAMVAKAAEEKWAEGECKYLVEKLLGTGYASGSKKAKERAKKLKALLG